MARLGNEVEAAQDRFAWAIGEANIGEFDATGANAKVGRIDRFDFLRRLVKKIIEQANADQLRGQVNVKARDALGRLIGHHQRKNKGKEAAGVLPQFDDAQSAINDDNGDRHAAQGFGERA